VARIEGARHGHLLEAWHHTGGCHLATGRDQRHHIAHAHAHLARQLLAQHDVEGARRQQLEHLGIGGGQIGHLALARGVNAAHDGAFHVLAAGNQPLRRHKGRGPDHFGVLLGLAHGGVHVLQRLTVGRKDLDVRYHAEHAVAHLFLKAIHHRQHDDERSHAQGDAQHGDPGDEGDEAIAPCGAAGARVAPAQSEFVRNLHTWPALWHWPPPGLVIQD